MKRVEEQVVETATKSKVKAKNVEVVTEVQSQ